MSGWNLPPGVSVSDEHINPSDRCKECGEEYRIVYHCQDPNCGEPDEVTCGCDERIEETDDEILPPVTGEEED